MIINYNSEPQGIWTFFSITSSIFLRINFHTGRIWPKPQSGRISVVLTKRVVKFGNTAFNEHILMNFKEITLSRSIQLRFLQSPNEIKTSLIQHDLDRRVDSPALSGRGSRPSGPTSGWGRSHQNSFSGRLPISSSLVWWAFIMLLYLMNISLPFHLV